MEILISRLLNEFEAGKIDRRQLIRSLAATSGLAAAPMLSAEPPAFKAVAVNHISYEVSDYAKTRDFYRDLLGMNVSHDDGHQCYMEFGATHFIPRNAHVPTGTARIGHIAYTIDPWDRREVEKELTHRGLKPKPDEETSFHITDPNGYDLQICSREMKP